MARESGSNQSKVIAAIAALVLIASARAQDGVSPDISSAWDGLLEGAIKEAEVDPALTVEQTSTGSRDSSDFLNHFFFDSQTTFIHQNTSFSGLPTQTSAVSYTHLTLPTTPYV